MGGLIQLAAYGNADVYLTGDPQITFWKTVFMRHSNFAIESIEQPFTGNPSFGSGIDNTSNIAVSLPKNTADMIHKCHLQVTLKRSEGSNATLKDNFGLKLIKRAIVSVDGMDIDSQTGEWMEYWNEYTMESGKEDGYKEMIGNSKSFEEQNEVTVIIPLQFYFCRSPGLSLPIHALQFSEVKIKLDLHDRSQCCNDSNNDIYIDKCSLFVDYIYLDIAEKEQILQSDQTFLITQVQDVSGSIQESNNGDEQNVKLDFIHPVKELIWCFKDSGGELKTMSSAYLTMNGSQKRASERPEIYYRVTQPYNHHSRIPKIKLYMYSFALKPEDPQPSGSCNFSRLDNAYLYFKLKTGDGTSANKVKVYATNVNLFKIKGNKGALMYS